MRLLTLLLIVALPASLVGFEAQGIVEQTRQYEVVMFEGIPPESFPRKDRKKLVLEKPLLVAPVDADGNFQAKLNDAMIEGRLKSVKDGRVEVEITQSKLYSTSGFPINARVKLNQGISPAGYAFDSIVFSYYFRVRHKTGGKQERPGNERHPNT